MLNQLPKNEFAPHREVYGSFPSGAQKAIIHLVHPESHEVIMRVEGEVISAAQNHFAFDRQYVVSEDAIGRLWGFRGTDSINFGDIIVKPLVIVDVYASDAATV